jgi:hypothetical protein
MGRDLSDRAGQTRSVVSLAMGEWLPPNSGSNQSQILSAGENSGGNPMIVRSTLSEVKRLFTYVTHHPRLPKPRLGLVLFV